MPVERTTPQLVKKGKGKKRPGYRGDAAYRSGSAQASSIGQGNVGSKASFGGGKGRDRSGRSEGASGADRSRVSAQQEANHRAAIAAAQEAKRKETRKNTTKFGYAKPKSKFGGLGSLIMSGLGMLMGIPGLGLLTGGLGKIGEGLGSLNDKIQSTDFARSKTLMDYLDAKKYGGIDARDRAASKNMREAKAIQTAMDMRSTTLDPREMARVGLQMPTAPMSKPTFSDPFANTVGTTANTINDAVSSNSIPTVNGVPMIDTGSVYQDNLNFFDNLNKGIVVNNEPPMVNTDNVMQGSVLDAKPKKGIMQMISDAFISPAGADEFDMEAFQKAGADKGFFGANDELEAMKEYYDAAKSLSAPGSKFAGATNPNEIRSFIETQSNIPFGGGSYGVNMDMVPTNFMNTTEDFTTQKDPLTFFADGGVASMFTRRG